MGLAVAEVEDDPRPAPLPLTQKMNDAMAQDQELRVLRERLEKSEATRRKPVSYTHLTLPTILLV